MDEEALWEKCPACPPTDDELEGEGMWWDGDFVVVCETCHGLGFVKHEHQ